DSHCPDWPISRKHVPGYVPIASGQPGPLHRRALEIDHPFVEGKIALEADQIILCIDRGGRCRRDDLGFRFISGHFGQGYFGYRRSYLAGERLIVTHLCLPAQCNSGGDSAKSQREQWKKEPFHKMLCCWVKFRRSLSTRLPAMSSAFY